MKKSNHSFGFIAPSLFWICIGGGALVLFFIYLIFYRHLFQKSSQPQNMTKTSQETCTSKSQNVNGSCILSYTFSTCVRRAGNASEEYFSTTFITNTEETKYDTFSDFFGERCGGEQTPILTEVGNEVGSRSKGYNFSVWYKNKHGVLIETIQEFNRRRSEEALTYFENVTAPSLQKNKYPADAIEKMRQDLLRSIEKGRVGAEGYKFNVQ